MKPDIKKKFVLAVEIGDRFKKLLIDDLDKAPRATRGWTDKHGVYHKPAYSYKRRGDGAIIQFTDWNFYYHFFGDGETHLLGAYSIDPDGNCKLGSVDIDGKKNTDDEAKDMHAVDQFEALVAVIRELGIRPLLVKSRSGSGFHVHVLSETPVQAARTRRLMKAMCCVARLPPSTEVYPKQDEKDLYGNLLALPGGQWWNEQAKKKGYDCGSWLLDDDFCSVPLEEWPALLDNADRLSPERFAKAEADLEAMGRERLGKSPFELPSPVARTFNSQSTGEAGPEAWTPSDIEAFLASGGLKSEYSAYSGGHRWRLERCPWTNEHTGDDPSGSAVLMEASGKLGFKCHHAHCDGRGWTAFRQRVDHTWRRAERPCGGKTTSRIYSGGKLVIDTVAGIFLAVSSILPSSASTAPTDTRCTPATTAKIALASVREDCDRYWPAVPVPLTLKTKENHEWGWKLVPCGKPRGTPKMREPGDDYDAEKKHEVEAERIRASRREFRKLVKLKKGTRDYLRRTAHYEKENVFSRSPWVGNEIKPPTPLDPKDYDYEKRKKHAESEAKKRISAFIGYTHAKTCCEMLKTFIGHLGTTKKVPDACGKAATCPGCANCAARDMGRYAAEAWGMERVTVVTNGDGKYVPDDYSSIKRMRQDAEKACRQAEKGPRKKRKKKLKEGEIAPPLEPEPEKVVYARRYFEGVKCAVIIGAPELHDALGRRFMPRRPDRPDTDYGYTGQSVPCGLHITSRVLSTEQAIRLIFGLDVDGDGCTDEAQNASLDSVWMEPAAELLRREKAVEEHLSGKLEAEMYDDDDWFKKLDILATQVFCHPYVRAHKAKRHSANEPGKTMFAMPNPKEMRAWKRAKLLEEKPELALIPEEKFKVVALHHHGLPVKIVENYQEKEAWECAKEIHDAQCGYLSVIGRDDFNLAQMVKKNAEYEEPTPEEMYASKKIHFRPAFGYDPATHGCREYAATG